MVTKDQELGCLKKRKKGNVYADKDFAKMVCKRIKKQFKIPVKVFNCPVCSNYHVGKWIKRGNK